MNTARTVRTTVGIAAGITLFVGLCAHGVRAYTPPADPTGGGDFACQVVTETTAQVSPPRVSSQEEFDRIILARERAIVARLGLTPAQKKQYDALRVQQDEKTRAFRNRRPHRPEEGMELNLWWRSRIQQVFTSEQYAEYLRLWGAGSGAAAPKKVSASASAGRTRCKR
jgi:hypothetical protein